MNLVPAPGSPLPPQQYELQYLLQVHCQLLDSGLHAVTQPPGLASQRRGQRLHRLELPDLRVSLYQHLGQLWFRGLAARMAGGLVGIGEIQERRKLSNA